MNRISSNYEENVQWFNDVLGAGRSCDMVCRDLYVGGRRARFWVIDGFGGDAILERMGAFWLSLQPEAVQGLTEMQQFADRYVTFMEVNVSYDRDDIVTSVLMGKSLLVMEGLSGAALIDAKEYPSRSVGEPPDGKVLRGSHDGFIEAVVPNMAMLRRRIRDPHLTMEGLKVGQRTHSDVALCYLDDRVDHALLDELRHKLQNIQANSLTMAQESVAEAIRPKQWYNPFPKVRYTERPDTAAACVMEGSIILMVDNSAAVMILPTTFFDFTQEANDFYFPPLVGTYLRVLRVTVFLISLLITEPLVSVFTKPASPVYQLAVTGNRICTTALLFIGFNIFSSGMFTALNNGIVSAVLAFTRSFVFMIVCLLALPALLGVTGIWLANPAAELLAVILAAWMLMKYRKKYRY